LENLNVTSGITNKLTDLINWLTNELRNQPAN